MQLKSNKHVNYIIMFIKYNNNFHTLKGNIMFKMIIDPKNVLPNPPDRFSTIQLYVDIFSNAMLLWRSMISRQNLIDQTELDVT